MINIEARATFNRKALRAARSTNGSDEAISELHGISRRSLVRARSLIEGASSDLLKDAYLGRISLAEAVCVMEREKDGPPEIPAQTVTPVAITGSNGMEGWLVLFWLVWLGGFIAFAVKYQTDTFLGLLVAIFAVTGWGITVERGAQTGNFLRSLAAYYGPRKRHLVLHAAVLVFFGAQFALHWWPVFLVYADTMRFTWATCAGLVLIWFGANILSDPQE